MTIPTIIITVMLTMIMQISRTIIMMIMNINNDQKQWDGNQHFFVDVYGATLFFKVLLHPSSTQPGLRSTRCMAVVLESLSLVTDLEENLVETGIQLDKEMG